MTPGAPKLIIEVLSNTEQDRKRDRETKLKLYSVKGVLKYWIVDRQQQAIEVYRRKRGILKKAMTWLKTDRMVSPTLPEFSCELASLYRD